MDNKMQSVLIKVRPETYDKLRKLAELSGLTIDECIDLVLNTFIIVTTCITNKGRSLYLYGPYNTEMIRIDTTNYQLLFPPDARGYAFAFSLTRLGYLISLLKRVREIVMLPNLSQVFAYAVDLSFRISEAQIRRPKYLLVSNSSGSTAFEEVSITLDIPKLLRERGLVAVCVGLDSYEILRTQRKTIHKDQKDS